MQISVSFDQNVSSLPQGFVAAVNYVVNYFDSLFTNPITVNIDLGYGEIAGQSLEAYPVVSGPSICSRRGAGGLPALLRGLSRLMMSQ